MTYIQLSNVIKRYDHHLAVDNMNLTIKKGEIFGLLGPNGAGKSTTIKMITGLLKPNSGDILVDGMNVRKYPLQIKKKIGLVPQEIALYENLTARENVEFFGSLYGLKGRNLKEKTAEALQFVELLDRQNEKPKKFSGGMKRRLNIACAIVHQPEIIIMDEPTVGIDPQSRKHILNSVQELNRKGTTILYTSHYIEEVESLCQRVGIIDYGKLIACGKKHELISQINTEEKILIEVSEVQYIPLQELKEIGGLVEIEAYDNKIEILTMKPRERLQNILQILLKNHVQVRSIHLQESDLESVFLELTGRKIRD